MRAFIAIETSEEIKDALARVEAHLKYSGADVKWVKPEMIHLTLKFLGEITDEKCGEVKLALDTVAGATKPFDIALKDVGAFPKLEHPRVLWVGLDKGAPETIRIANHIEDALSNAGFTKEDRPFSPHLTIGRVRSSLNYEKLKEKISSASTQIRLSGISPHSVTSIILFQSTLTPQGPVYTKLHESVFIG